MIETISEAEKPSKSSADAAPQRATRGSHASRREITRTRVFSAAIACLHEQGYAGSSTLAVARRADISRGALVKQFPTKASLYASLVESLLDELREETIAHVRRFPPGLPRALARIDHTWELYKEPKAFAVLEVMLGARGDPELSERLAQVGRSRQLIEKQLLGEDFEDMGIKDRRTAGLAILQVVATVRGLALERLINKQSSSLEAAFNLQRGQTQTLLRSLMIQK
jgi:AcrR family transcriptional regulator